MISLLDIRKRGVKALKEELETNEIGIIAYRGKKRYVVMDIEKYEELREKELELRLAELKSKNITPKSAKEHIREIEELLK